MSNVARVASTAANTLVKPLNIEDVFSTYLYTGTGSTQTITNGIDLSGEGGLLWIKSRTDAYNHYLHDTTTSEPWHFLQSNLTDAINTGAGNADLTISAFNSDGFVVGSASGVNNGWGGNGSDFASWSFRKAPKFFDIVTYTGDGSGDWDTRQISHNLGSTPGFIIIKRTDSADDWWCAARKSSTQYAISTNGATSPFGINTTNSAGAGSISDCATDSVFMPGFIAQTSDANVNNATYVAYLFAHNDGDGGFGPTGDKDIIKCGSFTSTSGTDEIDLGFEPQWILIKRADASNSWVIVDELRGNPVGSAANYLEPNGSFAESTLTGWTTPTPTGFTNSYPIAGGTFIYIAIRRGPMAVPESATDVFDVEYSNQNSDGYYANLGVVTDTWLYKDKSTSSNWFMRSRLTGANYLNTNSTNAETSQSISFWDNMNGVGPTGVTASTDTNAYSWVWKRAPNFFDVVTYTGSSSAGTLTVNHNLGVKPELIIAKARTSGTQHWNVLYGFTSTGEKYFANIGTSAAAANGAEVTYGSGLLNSEPTDSAFVVRTDTGIGRGQDYIAYLFASLDGISKVGTFTYTQGVAQNIDCGFSSGARFVLYKRTSGTSGWTVFDTERGIVAGNDAMLFLNTTSAEDSNYDFIDPYSGGFALSDSTANLSGDYIFYAIA